MIFYYSARPILEHVDKKVIHMHHVSWQPSVKSEIDMNRRFVAVLIWMLRAVFPCHLIVLESIDHIDACMLTLLQIRMLPPTPYPCLPVSLLYYLIKQKNGPTRFTPHVGIHIPLSGTSAY